MAEDKFLPYPAPPGEKIAGRSTFPRKAVVDLRDGSLTIDGEKFPWYITSEGIDIEGLGDSDRIPVLKFGIFAETVEVIPEDIPETTKN